MNTQAKGTRHRARRCLEAPHRGVLLQLVHLHGGRPGRRLAAEVRPNIRVIRLMCSGRVDPQFILDALAKGADGVLIGGCPSGDCHYVEGNYKILRRFQMLKRMLKDLGIEDERVRLEWISAAEGEKVKRVVNEMVEKIQAAGPAGLPERDSRNGTSPRRAGRRAATCRARQINREGGRLPMSKPKVAFYWCASCGGCEETVVDLAEDILGVVEAVDIVLWPVAMDFKYKDIEAMPDKSIIATLLNGAIRSTEQEEMAHLLRRKSQFLIAYGACAQRRHSRPGQPVPARADPQVQLRGRADAR